MHPYARYQTFVRSGIQGVSSFYEEQDRHP
jgi:hypothetical protein